MPAVNVVLLADTHLGFDYPMRPRVWKRRRGHDFFDNYQRVLDHAAATRPDMVVHGGDFFFRSRVHHKIVDMAYEPLYRLAEKGVPIVVAPGNHERSKMPPSLWLTHPNIHVFDRPRTFSFITDSGVSLSIAGFPFARGDVRGNFNAILEETGWADVQSEVKLLSMHQAVESATVGPSDYTFRRGKDTIRLADIPQGFAAVLAGHIHRRQVLNGEGVPVVYPGSIERTSFAERDEPKGFVHVELARSLEGRWTMSQARFHPLPTRPMIDVNIDADVPFTGMREHLLGLVAGLDRDSIVRLRCVGDPEESFKARLTATFLRSVFPTSMSVQIGMELYVEPYRARGHARA